VHRSPCRLPQRRFQEQEDRWEATLAAVKLLSRRWPPIGRRYQAPPFDQGRSSALLWSSGANASTIDSVRLPLLRFDPSMGYEGAIRCSDGAGEKGGDVACHDRREAGTRSHPERGCAYPRTRALCLRRAAQLRNGAAWRGNKATAPVANWREQIGICSPRRR
jgi:hypothetical protein